MHSELVGQAYTIIIPGLFDNMVEKRAIAVESGFDGGEF